MHVSGDSHIVASLLECLPTEFRIPYILHTDSLQQTALLTAHFFTPIRRLERPVFVSHSSRLLPTRSIAHVHVVTLLLEALPTYDISLGRVWVMITQCITNGSNLDSLPFTSCLLPPTQLVLMALKEALAIPSRMSSFNFQICCLTFPSISLRFSALPALTYSILI
eukprot:TRINITY_DN18936_c0_g1::TRINITY_DN18936_c0_g1_i1::g.21574::m.21574 TRINITY_DN18936_c0_g1::TRINITY_DN18936_c0_g1_i1::g.21574  ORF type:complete len:166 (-),score=3.59,NETI/PF14044.1/0.081 TRINITY_DN18936_c0_g1_i1:297-794(-)